MKLTDSSNELKRCTLSLLVVMIATRIVNIQDVDDDLYWIASAFYNTGQLDTVDTLTWRMAYATYNFA